MFMRAGAAGAHARGTWCPRGPPRAASRDRKSTRLNSSHITISYAVFCLKKKKLFPHTSDAILLTHMETKIGRCVPTPKTEPAISVTAQHSDCTQSHVTPTGRK